MMNTMEIQRFLDGMEWEQGRDNAPPGFPELPTIPGSPPNLVRLPEGCIYAPRCACCFEPCRIHAPPLVHLAAHSVRCHRVR